MDDTLYNHKVAAQRTPSKMGSYYYKLLGLSKPAEFVQSYHHINSNLDPSVPDSFDTIKVLI